MKVEIVIKKTRYIPVNDLHPCDYRKNYKPRPEEDIDFFKQ